MGLELRQQLRLSQQLIMTPQLQMAIKLLQLSHLELLDVIRQEMEENAALEEGEEFAGPKADLEPGDGEAEAPMGAETPAEQEVSVSEDSLENVDWENFVGEYNTEYNSPGQIRAETEEQDAPRYEAFMARKETLTDHLLWQAMLHFSDETDKKIAHAVICNLDADGYLKATTGEVAHLLSVEAEQVEAVLGELQQFDPPGVCARNISECLLIQARQLGADTPLVKNIITRWMNHLQNRNYKAIAQAAKAPQGQVRKAVAAILSLEPKPGRVFSEEEPRYITPDIYVYKVGDEYEIVLNDDGMPKLHVSRFYQEALSKDGELSDEAKAYVKGKLRSAAWLIRSIHQRQRTIYKVMESILKFQRPFFDKGIAHLKPMVLREVAEDIGMHEATISRVTTNKYVHTPHGIFELKFFFNSSIKRVHGEAIASASVKEKISRIVKNEDPSRPYSDEKIMELLAAENIRIARRTVAKYREALGILPSGKRKQLA
ncbi:MAG: RNA polymerase factor sigma-54 [Deltaproteobacteria bacterium]|nr:RNA polymerase factor sigma-54 [Deltaproteobacteria bacterium]